MHLDGMPNCMANLQAAALHGCSADASAAQALCCTMPHLHAVQARNGHIRDGWVHVHAEAVAVGRGDGLQAGGRRSVRWHSVPQHHVPVDGWLQPASK